MKLYIKASLALAIAMASTGSNAVSDPNMYININGTSVGNIANNIHYSDGITGLFDEFGFNQLRATSVYDITDGTVFGSFYDTNRTADLTALGLPLLNQTALDGTSTVSLTMPTYGQINIDTLSPDIPGTPGSDHEGYSSEWQLLADYRLNGTLLAGGPVYTSGTLDVYLRDYANGGGAVSSPPDVKVLSLSLTGSLLEAANLNLFFDITFALDDFLFIETFFGSGIFIDAADVNAPDSIRMTLDTNVDPPIPTTSQLLGIDLGGTSANDVAVRQANLDGTVVSQIIVPEPASLALLGLGMLGIAGFRVRRRT